MNASPVSATMINDLETLRVISDPLRLKIFRTVGEYNLGGDLCSVKQISDTLGIPPAKLYYHFKLLESHGLLKVAETRLVSGIVEKLYRVPAPGISVANELFEDVEHQASLYPMFPGVINEVLEEIQDTLMTPEKSNLNANFTISRSRICLPRNRMREFSEKLALILKEIESEEKDASEEVSSPYTFFYACYPEVKRLGMGTTDTDPGAATSAEAKDLPA